MFDINRGNKNKFPQCFRWLSKKTHSPFLTANVVWVNYWALCCLCPGEWICKHSLLIYRWFWAEWLHIWWYDDRNDSRPTLKDQMYVMAFSEDVSQIQQVVIYLCLCTYIGMWVRRGEHNWKRRSCYDIYPYSVIDYGRLCVMLKSIRSPCPASLCVCPAWNFCLILRWGKETVINTPQYLPCPLVLRESFTASLLQSYVNQNVHQKPFATLSTACKYMCTCKQPWQAYDSPLYFKFPHLI